LLSKVKGGGGISGETQPHRIRIDGRGEGPEEEKRRQEMELKRGPDISCRGLKNITFRVGVNHGALTCGVS
jgi:hypothetical protein